MRDWTKARAKVGYERKCRVCPSVENIAAAHTIGRVHDERVVDPNDVVPLCTDCHADYDARKLDLLPYLTLVEQAAAVAHVGIVRALHRLTSSRVHPRDEAQAS